MTIIDWKNLGEEFEEKNAKEILEHSLNELSQQGEIIFLTAFGPEGCVIFKIIHDLLQQSKVKKQNFSIANLDTGYQFKETLDLNQELEKKYGLEIKMIQPALSIQEQDQRYGKDLFKSDPDQCCYLRKLVPLNDLLSGKLAWITSIRKDQSDYRALAKAFEYDKKFKLGKINPLINWTKSDVWKYIHENKIPYNALLDQGYDSIGCEPCTIPGSDRKGRWAGKDKIECGLHIQDSEQGGEFII
jgi:phosphoadenosine phosphosulfate reductase